MIFEGNSKASLVNLLARMDLPESDQAAVKSRRFLFQRGVQGAKGMLRYMQMVC